MNIIKKSNKKILMSILIIILLIIIVINIGISVAYKNRDYLNNKKIDGISFENASLEYENGISTFSVDIYNENNKEYKIDNITINFKNKSSKVTKIVEYIDDTLESSEGRKIIETIDKDLTDSVSIEYIINK